MQACKFCGQPLGVGSTFCGNCGRNQPQATSDDSQTVEVASSEFAKAWNKVKDQEGDENEETVATYGTIPMSAPQSPVSPKSDNDEEAEEEEEEEEQKRRRRLAGLALPVMGDILLSDGPPTVPIVQGVPSPHQAPVVHGLPPGGGGPVVGPGGNNAAGAFRPASAPNPVSPPGRWAPPSAGPRPGPVRPGGRPAPHQSIPGCAIWLIVAVFILASFFGAVYTVFAPTITLNGVSSVAQGGTFVLRGSGFLANSTITLTLDQNTPLYLFYHQNSPQARSANVYMRLSAASLLAQQASLASNTLKADGSGRFNANIAVGQNWSAGSHTIHASESLSLRSASTTFNVTAPGQGDLTPTPTDMPTATDTPTPGETPTVMPPPGQSTLTAVKPGSVSLGPVVEGSDQPVKAQITLSTAGDGAVAWVANWNQQQAPWLQLTSTTGQIQAPNTQAVGVQAVPTGLKPNTYTVAVTFSSPQSQASLTLNVSLVVQATCLNANPTSLNFTGTAGAQDPPAQTFNLTNCGMTTKWNGIASTTSGGGWLSIDPASNSINAGWNEGVKVSVATSELAAGNYTGNVAVTSGSRQVNIPINLTLQAPKTPPTLTATPTSFNARKDCTLPTGTRIWLCTVTLSSNKDASGNLGWSAGAGAGASVSPASGSLTPGESAKVTLSVITTYCDTGATVSFTFKGPNNSQVVNWSCPVIIIG